MAFFFIHLDKIICFNIHTIQYLVCLGASRDANYNVLFRQFRDINARAKFSPDVQARLSRFMNVMDEALRIEIENTRSSNDNSGSTIIDPPRQVRKGAGSSKPTRRAADKKKKKKTKKKTKKRNLATLMSASQEVHKPKNTKSKQQQHCRIHNEALM